MSQVLKEVADTLENTQEHIATERAQKNEMLERTHASLKKALNIETGERRLIWQKIVNIAVSTYNTSYQTTVGCKSSTRIHGSALYNVLHSMMGIRVKNYHIPNSQIAHNALEQTEMFFQDVRKTASLHQEQSVP